MNELQSLEYRFDKIDESFDRVDKSLAELKADVKELRTDQGTQRNRLTSVEVKIAVIVGAILLVPAIITAITRLLQ